MNSHRKGCPRIANLLPMIVLALLVPSTVTAGSEIVAGPEIWIDGPDNVEPGTNRNFPDVAVDNNGHLIHVWIAYGEVSRGDVFVRRFDTRLRY